MKIAYIVPSLANRGPIIVVKDLVTVMTAHGHDCIVYYFDEKCELNFDCETKRIKFVKSIDFSQFDVIHSHGIRSDIYLFIHKPIFCHCVCVSTIHSFIMEDLASQYNKYFAFLVGKLWIFILKRHNKIVVLSHIALDYYRKWFALNKLSVVYNTRILEMAEKLTDEEEKEIIDFKKDSIILGVNAFLSPIKGVDLMIKSLPYLDNHIKLWIVGDGKSTIELQNLSNELGVRGRVFFAGYRKNAYRYLPYYDLFMMTSRSEGFPLSLLEAMLYKKKIVCSNIPIFREIFSDRDVIFFELDNVVSLVKSIIHALQIDKSPFSHKCYWNSYSPACFYRNYLAIYTH